MRRFVFGMTMLSFAMMAPGWASADDQEIAKQIVQKLKQHKESGEFHGFSLDLQVEQGVVWLKGHVADDKQEYLALDIARRVPGVVKVVDAIEVQPLTAAKATPAEETSTAAAETPEAAAETSTAAAAETPNDAQPAATAEPQQTTDDQEPVTEDQEDRAPVNIEQPDEVHVASRAAYSEPEPPASSRTTAQPAETPVASRAKTAESRTRLRPAKISDEQIAETIIGQLRRHKESGALRGFGVDVSVTGGDVWLKGRVANQEQLSLVIDTARHVSGVKQVVNDLTITTPKQPQSSEERPVVNAVAENHSPIQPKPQPAVASTSGPGQAMTPVIAGKLIPISAIPVSAQQVAAGQPAPSRSASPQAVPMKAVPLKAIPLQQVAMGAAPPQAMQMQAMHAMPVSQAPRPYAPATLVDHSTGPMAGHPMPMQTPTAGGYGVAPARFDHPQMPGYAWPSYAAHPNYAAVTYPKQYSAHAWPYIGPFYPYPQVPLGWRRVELQWDDGWWFLDHKSK